MAVPQDQRDLRIQGGIVVQREKFLFYRGVGTFAPPHAVINDFKLLETLEPEDKRGGYIEAVKVACIRDAKFFETLEANADKLAAFVDGNR